MAHAKLLHPFLADSAWQSTRLGRDHQHSHRGLRQTYTYAPLANPQKQIRLLEILPGSEEDALQLRLYQENLETAPDFVAISYTWGEPGDDRTVYLDGRPYSVRKNCHYALWQLRIHHPGGLVWIDSLCILQQDLYEKNEQVRMMGDIYARATHVFACVGCHSDNSEILPNVVPVEDKTSAQNPTLLYSRWVGWIQSQGECQISRLCHAFDAFCRRPYWNRIWIMQEIALSNELSILCGEHMLPWHRVQTIWDIHYASKYNKKAGGFLSRLSISIPPPVSHINRLGQMIGSRPHSLAPEGALQASSDALCSNILDRIYAVAALVNWERTGLPTLSPDYSITAFELAVEVARYLPLGAMKFLLAALDIRLGILK